MSSAVVIIWISFLIFISPFVAKITRLPVVVVEILLGSIIGYLGFFENNEMFKLIAKVGFLYLMFLTGMETNLKEFNFKNKKLLNGTLIYFISLYSFAFLAYYYFNLKEIYIVAIPIFSLGMLMVLVKEYGKNDIWLNLALTIGIIGELVSILAITILSGSLEQGFNKEFYFTMFAMFLFLIIFILFFKFIKNIFWWFPHLKTAIMPIEDQKNQDIRFSMSLFFIMVAVTLYLKIDVVLGAFLAGIFVSTYFKHKKELPEKLSSFGFGLFAPIFFIYVGSTLPVESIFDFEVFKNSLFLVFLIIFGRLISAFLAFFHNMGFKNTILFALSDSMPLTFLVAIATIGLNSNTLNLNEYYSFIIASMILSIFMLITVKILRQIFFKIKDVEN